MEQLIIKENDFGLSLGEKNKLYDMFGKDYMEKVPGIFAQLADILNSDSFFTEMVEKRIYDKGYKQTALENLRLYILMKLYNFSDDEINYFKSKKNIHEITDENIVRKVMSILGNTEQYSYLDILGSITQHLLENTVQKILKLYVNENGLNLINCRGVEDIPQCNFIIERYKKYIDSLSVDATPTAPVVDEDGHIIICQGDLFHGTSYLEKVIESIATKGLVSGQLVGIEEDGETYLCVDFFKATKDSTTDEICAFGKQYTNGTRQVVFVINHSNLEGINAMFPDLTNYDAYNENTKEGQKAREIVNVKGLPLNHSTGAAILIGVPPCMISSIIINSEVENDSQKVDFIASNFPKATIISRTTGEILKNPMENYKK